MLGVVIFLVRNKETLVREPLIQKNKKQTNQNEKNDLVFCNRNKMVGQFHHYYPD